jgi:hypothetical protein
MSPNAPNIPDLTTKNGSGFASPLDYNTEKHTFSDPRMNLLCKRGRELAGGVVPLFKQDAKVKLYVHLKTCLLCNIPDMEPLNSPRALLEQKMTKVINEKLEERSYDQKLFNTVYEKAVLHLSRGHYDLVRRALKLLNEIHEKMKTESESIRIIESTEQTCLCVTCGNIHKLFSYCK